MNILSRWMERRRAAAKVVADKREAEEKAKQEAEEKEKEERMAKLKSEIDEIKESLVNAGFIPLSRHTATGDYGTGTVWAVAPNKQIVKVLINHKGGYAITKV